MLRTGTHEQVKLRFPEDVALHTMRVLHDDGLYRHVRFKDPDCSMYWFDLITWPGHLIISGDMGTLTFARDRDMFPFFNDSSISPDYWAEKLTSSRDEVKQYSRGTFLKLVKERIEDVQDDYPFLDLSEVFEIELQAGWTIDEEGAARELLRHIDDELKKPIFDVAWEWDLREFTYRYLWNCYAIQWGVKKYYEERPTGLWSRLRRRRQR